MPGKGELAKPLSFEPIPWPGVREGPPLGKAKKLGVCCSEDMFKKEKKEKQKTVGCLRKGGNVFLKLKKKLRKENAKP